MDGIETDAQTPELAAQINRLRSTVIRKIAQRLGIDATNEPVEVWVKAQLDAEVLDRIERRHFWLLNKLRAVGCWLSSHLNRGLPQ